MATVTSSPSVAVSAILPVKNWWIRDLSDATLDMPVDVTNVPLEITSDEAQATYRPLGRTHGLVVTDVIQGQELTMKMSFYSPAEYGRWKNLRQQQRTQLLQSPFGDNFYFRWGKSRKTLVQNTTPQMYDVEIDIIEVSDPSDIYGLAL